MAFNIVNDPTVISTGGDTSTGVSEEIIASYEYDSLAAGLAFPGIFNDLEQGEDGVVRFMLGQEYTSTSQFRMQMEKDGAMQTGNQNWYHVQGFQQSTSAYNSASTNQSHIELAGSGGYDWWHGTIVFPWVDGVNISNNVTQTLDAYWSIESLKYNSSGVTKAWGQGGYQTQTGVKTTGFRIYENSFGNASREIGKPTWSGRNAWVVISKRIRTPTE